MARTYTEPMTRRKPIRSGTGWICTGSPSISAPSATTNPARNRATTKSNGWVTYRSHDGLNRGPRTQVTCSSRRSRRRASHGGKGECCQNMLGSRRSGESRSNGSDMETPTGLSSVTTGGRSMLVGYVSDESYAALADVAIEVRGAGGLWQIVRSWPSGAVHTDLPPGDYEVCLTRPGYAWPKWCRGGGRVEFRVHAVEPYKLGLWRYGARKEFVRNIGWYDNHGPRAIMQ